jgi:hypothetical protein
MSSNGTQLFCRPCSARLEKLGALIAAMASSANEAERALAKNLIWDHRVTDERAEKFFEFLENEWTNWSASPQEFRNGLFAYRRRLVAANPAAFEELPASISNLITGTHELVHVCDVTAKLMLMTDGRRTSPEFEAAKLRLGRGAAAFARVDDVDKLLVTVVSNARRAERFVDAFLAMVVAYQRISPWNPTWAAVWQQYEPTKVTGSPNNWLEVVGKQAPQEPHWLLLLRYPSTGVKTLYRPTQLEAGDFPLHFPSPPCAPLEVGGIAMQVGPDASSIWRILSEFIHTEVPFERDHWEATGIMLAQTTVSSYDSLSTYRRRHLQVLRDGYGDKNIDDWVETP